MKPHTFFFLLLLLFCSPLLQAQDMASAAESWKDNIRVNINTQVDNAWGFSGNIILDNTIWNGQFDEPGMTFHNLETMDDILADELDRMMPPEVALASFSASVVNRQVSIDWTSLLTEKEIQAFFVQRSPNGTDWTDIGMFTTENRTKVLAPYSFVDNQPMRGSNFYRLRQVNQQSAAHYSDIIAVEVMEQGYHVTHMYPNPVVFGANIDFELFTPSTVDIQLFDVEEKRIGTIYSDLTSMGHHQIEINLDQLPRGLYTCQIKVGTSISKRTLVK